MKIPKPKAPLNVWIETYGCQMNKNDSELVAGILQEHDISLVTNIEDASVALINTCSVRAHAEQRAVGRLNTLSHWKRSAPDRRIGVLGCMAQRAKQTLIDENPFVDFVAGPDAYRILPDLILNEKAVEAVQTRLTRSETYTQIQPLRKRTVSAWVTVMRGCDNFCSYCIVPYTRGRERSRSAIEIIAEIQGMVENGFVEITLLGQNVNSYRDGDTDFATLLRTVSVIDGLKRIRFMTSHPKDLSDRLLETIAAQSSVCNHIHLPLQAGSNRILRAMNRQYTREHYAGLAAKARHLIPDLGLTTDVLVGFPGETEADFQETLDLIRTLQFDDAFMYHYSVREGTKAAKLHDQVPQQEKLHRLHRLIELQRKITSERKRNLVGRTVNVLAESESKLSSDEWLGKTESNHTVVFPAEDVRCGEIVKVHIDACPGNTLRGHVSDPISVNTATVSRREACPQCG